MSLTFPRRTSYIEPANAIPDPLGYESAEEYQAAIIKLAEEHPGSIYEYALYAFRFVKRTDLESIFEPRCATITQSKSPKALRTWSDARAIVDSISGNESFFGTCDRISMPDEVLYFNTGTDRDKALLLYTLHEHSSVGSEQYEAELIVNIFQK